MTQVLAFASTATNPPISSSALNADATALLIGLLLCVVCTILTAIGWWKMFKKAGRPGWAAIIPVYDAWVFFEISGKPGWWALLGSISVIFFALILPYVGLILPLILYIIASFELARRFGKGIVFTIFDLILFSTIGFLILGFGKATYRTVTVGTSTHPPNTPPTPPDLPAQVIRPQSS